jgi:hypothetical protein
MHRDDRRRLTDIDADLSVVCDQWCPGYRKIAGATPSAAPLPAGARSLRSHEPAPCRLYRLPSVALGKMVVDDAHRLHERISGGRPDEAEAAFLQILRQRSRLGRRRTKDRPLSCGLI